MFAVNSIGRYAVVGLVLVGTGAMANELQHSIDAEISQATSQVNMVIQQDALQEARHNAWDDLITYEGSNGLLTLEQELEKQTDAIAQAAKQEAQKLAASYWRSIAPSFMVAAQQGE